MQKKLKEFLILCVSNFHFFYVQAHCAFLKPICKLHLQLPELFIANRELHKMIWKNNTVLSPSEDHYQKTTKKRCCFKLPHHMYYIIRTRTIPNADLTVRFFSASWDFTIET